MESVFLHPNAAALAKLMQSPSEVAADNNAESADQLTEPVEGCTSPKVETSTSAVLACAAPVLFFLQHLWTTLSGIASLITLLVVVNIVGWPGILPLLFVMLFLSEIFTAVTSVALLICLKWLLVQRLRPSDASAGPQRLAFLRWRVGRIIQKELEPTFALIRGTILYNYLLRALGARISASAVIETTGAPSLQRTPSPFYPPYPAVLEACHQSPHTTSRHIHFPSSLNSPIAHFPQAYPTGT